MGCLITIFTGSIPRLGALVVWLARPNQFSHAFNDALLLPLLGIHLLPFTTVMYVLLWTPGNGIAGKDWFWLVLAWALDLSHWAAVGRVAHVGGDRLHTHAGPNAT